MSRNRYKKFFCPHCSYQLLRMDSVDNYPFLTTDHWISLKCADCRFEIFGAFQIGGYGRLEESAVKLGARTYCLHNRIDSKHYLF